MAASSTSTRRPRGRLLLALLLLTTATVAADVAGSNPAAADTVKWCTPAPGGTCAVYMDINLPGSPRGAPKPGDPVGGDDGEAWCLSPGGEQAHWEVHHDQSQLRLHFPDAPPNAVLIAIYCFSEPDNTVIDEWNYDWVLPSSPRLPQPSPVGVSQWMWLGVETLIRPYRLAAEPPLGAPVTVDVPTFVWVENWQQEIWLQDCDYGTCVNLWATPHLSYHPGESEAGSKSCDPPGSRFNPESDLTAQQQADPQNACAYTYTLRTGVEDRPAKWSGRVVVTWTVRWQAGAESGTFDDIVLTVGVPREVQELHANVVDAELE